MEREEEERRGERRVWKGRGKDNENRREWRGDGEM